MIDFTKLGADKQRTHIEPRDIFMSLPSRDKKYEYPRDVQSEVWKSWFEERDKKNTIIKMNTGSGKTVVGLIILQSCLNEGKGPAVYVVPDKYLVQQVCSEAKHLGIKTATDKTDIDFLRNQSILVINIQTLINGRSGFGMRADHNVEIGSVLIDDVHACLADIENQYTISIPAGCDAYNSILQLFAESIKSQSENKYDDITTSPDSYSSVLVPFWDWQNKQNEVKSIIKNIEQDDAVKFSYPLIRDCLAISNCMITAKKIEISPSCIPIHKISSFERAERRIFMSATLVDDTVFVTALGLNPNDITKIITPEKADDIGDRLMIFPQVVNKSITDIEVKIKLFELSKQHNVVVIVPSFYRAKFWQDVASSTLSIKNMDAGISYLKAGHVGLTVLVNKYDGVDLPDDACRILVIDGLPNMRSEYDAYEQNVNPKSKRLRSEQVQKIEQGMGRGVRSNSDFCVVVLLGRSLAEVIYAGDGLSYFSEATREQFKLSEQIWEQVETQDINNLFAISNYCLDRNVSWLKVSREVLSSVKYNCNPTFSGISIALRKAFDLAELERYHEAVAILEEKRNETQEKEQKGLLKQYIASYTNFYNRENAQQLVLSALSDNRLLLKPIKGIQHTKIVNKSASQAQYLVEWVSENISSPNSYILKINSILDDLRFEPNTSKRFESAIKDLSFMLGIYSSRPEEEEGKGPDNFWCLDRLNFFVIECKNETTTDKICKHDCNQLNGSIMWFNRLYHDLDYTCYPIMIHNSNTFEHACSPHEDIRIMTPALLDKLKSAVRNFAQNVIAEDTYHSPTRITQLLMQFKLQGAQIVESYTTNYKTT